MSPALAAELKAQARAQGADLVGIASAAQPDEARHLADWLSSGLHASMTYMATRAAVRRELREWYPDAKSVLVCGFNYAGNAAEPAVPGKGRVSRYARLPDYHDSLKERLSGVLEWLKKRQPGADGRVFVDSSPVLERAYARLAGLGWVGKNTMLINRKNGSYFFIAGIALNLELATDGSDPVEDGCGTCTACLDACPTDAFVKERTLDASKCISYLTIENRGSVPEPLRLGVEDRLFGCDICQEVCPWNRFAKAGVAFPPPGAPALDLEELTALDDATFRARFRGSPLWRTKWRGLVRNALLLMGNSGDPRHAPTLERYAAHEDPVLSEQARWSLERCRSEDFAELMRRHHAAILGLCVSMLGDREEADDAAQEAFIKAYRGLGRFQRDAAFSTWVYRIASNHCLDRLRRRAREKSDSLEALLEAGGDAAEAVLPRTPSPAGALEDAELVERALAALPADYRLILVLRETQGLDYRELTQALDCSLDAVKTRLKRARRLLERTLRHLLGGSDV